MNRLTLKKRIGRLLTPVMNFTFLILQSLGFHLTRNHFYEPIPDTRQLKEKLWMQPHEIVGIDMNLTKQSVMLKEVFPKYINECKFSHKKTKIPYEFNFENEFFNALDAEILHCMVRHFKPKRIVEIGAGFSTLVSARASLMNKEVDGFTTELQCIEPYPNKTILEGFAGLSKLIQKPLQNIELSFFEKLDENDILFIDSSHVVKIGGDVIYEYLEILPRLRPGVIVHIHDIFFPDEYPKQWVLKEHKFWTEQYLLQAFLTFNTSFEVIWASSYMSLTNKELLENVIPSWRDSYKRMNKKLQKTYLTRDKQNVWPVSFWIKRKN